MSKKHRIKYMIDHKKVVTGTKHFNLTVLSEFKKRIESKTGTTSYKMLVVKCKCGIEKEIYKSNLTNGTTISCGSPVCSGMQTHGMFSGPRKDKNEKRTAEYRIWDNIKRRANVNSVQSKRGNYSKLFKKVKGISEEWKSFENFLRDMGHRPSIKHSIDRIDNTKGYSKENCRWSTPSEQMRNTIRNVFYLVNGVKLCRQDLAKLLDIDSNTIRYHENKLNKKDFNKYISERFQKNIVKL